MLTRVKLAEIWINGGDRAAVYAAWSEIERLRSRLSHAEGELRIKDPDGLLNYWQLYRGSVTEKGND